MKIKFLPEGKELEIGENQSVLELAHENDIHIQSVCKGVPSCAECRIQVKEGDHNLVPPGPKELALIGTAYFVDQSRLACQMRCFGDVTVDLSEQIEKEQRAKEGKRPRGRVAKEIGESQAVTGSLILQEGGRYSDTDEKIAERVLIEEQIKMARSRRKGGDKEDSQSSAAGEKPNKNRGKRRRNRSRNKNRQKQKS